jgi:hypothetical protein
MRRSPGQPDDQEIVQANSMNRRNFRCTRPTIAPKWRAIAYVLATTPFLLLIAMAWITAHN